MRSLQNRFYNTPLVHWTHAWQPHNWRISMKALARYQIILLGEQRHTGVNNLPKVVARQCISQESNPRPFERKSIALTTTPPSISCKLVLSDIIIIIIIIIVIILEVTSYDCVDDNYDDNDVRYDDESSVKNQTYCVVYFCVVVCFGLHASLAAITLASQSL